MSALSTAITAATLLLAVLIVNVVFMNKDGFLDITPDKVNTNMRAPYALLGQPTKPISSWSFAAGPTSEQCYKADYQRTLSLEPSFRQMTNNYKHKNGESCSAPNHDLILGIYQ
jgi:hypothetical protein